MSIWAEAYDLPHLADPGKKIAYLPTLDGRFGKHADVFREEGSVLLPSAYSRLSEVLELDPDDHSEDVGSVIHLFKRDVLGGDNKPKVVGSFVAERRPDGLESQATATTQISGRGLTSYFLDRVRLWAFDYPTSPANEEDWRYGAPNVLVNPGLEDGAVQPAQWAVWFDDTVDGGTWSLSIGGDSTSPIQWDATATDIKNAVELDVAAVISASVTTNSESDDDPGSINNPFIIEVTDPSGTDLGAFETTDIDLTNGTVFSETIREFGLLEIRGWTKSVNLARQTRDHGTYASDGFRLTHDGEPVHSGDFALRINGLSRYAGAMQIVRVIPGHRYTASLWIYTGTNDNKYRFVIRDRFEKYIAGPNGATGSFDLAANTWTEITHDFVVPDGVTEVIYRIAVVEDPAGDDFNPAPFYVDDLYLAPGAGPATVGDIWEQLLLDAQTDHNGEGRDALSWLVPTFTATLDSNGVAWDAERSLTLTAGDTYGQIAEAMQNLWGYVHRIRFDREDNTYYFDVFNPDYIEVDHSTTSTGTLTVGMNIRSGEVIKRVPQANYFLARNSDGLWSDDVDTSLTGPWGWADAPVVQPDTDTVADLDEIVARMKSQNLKNTFSLESEIADFNQVRVFNEIDVFHQVGINMGAKSTIPFTDMVVTSVVVDFKAGQMPSYQVFVNSDAFASTGAAALAEAVRRLLRKREKPGVVELGAPSVPGGLGGAPTLVVAASDALDSTKKRSDFECTGTDDYIEIQAALDAAASGTEGRVLLSEGTFNLDPAQVTVPSGVLLQGMGWLSTFIDDQGAGSSGAFIALANNASISDIGFLATQAGTAAISAAGTNSIHRISLQGSGAIGIDINGSTIGVRDVVTWCLTTTATITINTAGRVSLENLIFFGDSADNIVIEQSSFININGVMSSGNDKSLIRAVSPVSYLNISNVISSADGAPASPVLDLDVTFGHVDNTVIEFSDGEGILLNGSVNVTLAPTVTVYEADFHGIHLTDSQDCRIFASVRECGGATDNTYDHVILDGNSDKNRIGIASYPPASGNAPRYAVNVSASTCDDNEVVGCSFHDPGGTLYGTARFNNLGTGTITAWAGTHGDNID